MDAFGYVSLIFYFKFIVSIRYVGGYYIVLNCFNMHEIGLNFSIQHF